MFIARILFFRLHESPRYLVHAGRPREAIESLQLISRFNGSELEIDLEDVDDVRRLGPCTTAISEGGVANPIPNPTTTTAVRHETITTIFDVEAEQQEKQQQQPTSNRLTPPGSNTKDYHSVGESSNQLDSHTFATPATEYPPMTTPRSLRITTAATNPTSTVPEEEEGAMIPPSLTRTRSRSPNPLPNPPQPPPPIIPTLHPPPSPHQLFSHSRRRSSMSSRRRTRSSSFYEMGKTGPFRKLPRWIRRPLMAWLDRVAMVLSPEWARTTVLVWAVWCAMSLGVCFFWSLLLFALFHFLEYVD